VVPAGAVTVVLMLNPEATITWSLATEVVTLPAAAFPLAALALAEASIGAVMLTPV
jgi:hypothetical protein